jgi:type IV pilus assembly protein PilN
MIRINLLAVERAASKKKKRFTLADGQKVTICCTLILLLAGLFIGWRYWAMSRGSAQLDADIAAAQQETARLHSVIQQVQQFEQRRAQLQQRVVLIEQLRKGQSGPVHMLDQISRSLPPMLWLTEMKQTTDTIVTIEGRCSTLTGLSEFVGNLEATGYFKRSVEIVSTVTEALPQPPGEVIRFVIKAEFQQPAQPTGSRPAAADPTVASR